jgi:hypothetical protein
MKFERRGEVPTRTEPLGGSKERILGVRIEQA